MKTKKSTCKNCEKQFKESFKFCPYCGQQAKDELTVKVLFYNTISNYFSFDARFFKSFFPLVLKPGYLASKFIQGKRLLYLHPAQMYLFIAVVFFFMFSFIQRDQVQTLDNQLAKTLGPQEVSDIIYDKKRNDSIASVKSNKQKVEDSIERANLKKALKTYQVIEGVSEKEIDSLLGPENIKNKSIWGIGKGTKALDSLIKAEAPPEIIYKHMGMSKDAGALERRLYRQAFKFYKSRKGGSMLQTFYDAIPIAMFFLLPIFALILKILYFNRGLYAHHLVFSFYYFSFLFTVFSIILGINFIWDMPDWIDLLVVLSTFFYLLMAMKRFYQQGWFRSFIKTSVTAFLFLLFVAPLTVTILGIFAFLFY
ncbi:DUF3667 domain-containing protein [Tamlana sp. 2201CG12-4]|uniref:DUF3667 domain-containing protein n=1 Tax=Tamlana sp. 2201CG12-4 TaxID=3112582 RepID=UPI002DBC10FB|nr:DUF3667 domain-containing protein [Tamlana sp. 2201CG12-4]MEC3908001.1 DUF3667 domain-containing protein [Tamlana sp. 2201CG12-4]